MEDPNQKNEPGEKPRPADLASAKQEKKLDLEIEELRKKNRWWAQHIPVIVMLLGVAGFFFTVYQFQSQQSAEQQKDRIIREVDQRTKLQNQIRTDVDEILRSAREEKQTVSRVSFLLEDMKTVMKSRVNEHQKVSDIFPEYTRTLTDSLVILIRDDSDFNKNPRDVGLANTIVEHWEDYSDYLKEEPEKLQYILYEYTRALQNLRDQHPGYLEGLRLDKKTQGYEVGRKFERQKNEPILYGYFIDLVEGFKMHIEVLDEKNFFELCTKSPTEFEEDRKLKENAERDFQDAMHNQTISEHILKSFYPDEHCGSGR